jgi:hypothetical protein
VLFFSSFTFFFEIRKIVLRALPDGEGATLANRGGGSATIRPSGIDGQALRSSGAILRRSLVAGIYEGYWEN